MFREVARLATGKLSINVNEDCCICTFFIPQDLRPESTFHLKGRVQVSAANNIAKGDGVITVETNIKIILDAVKKGTTMFYCHNIEENSRKREGQNDPDWFVKTVNPYIEETDEYNSEIIRSMVKGAINQLETVVKLV